MTTHHFTDAENIQWLANLPKKSVAAKVIFKSDRGNVLLVKPNYKKSWQFPGGGVETNEDPRQAAVRELKEELNFEINKEDLILIDHVFRHRHDNLILIYEYSKSLAEDTLLKIQEDELEDYKFVEISAVPHLISDYYSEFWNRYNC